MLAHGDETVPPSITEAPVLGPPRSLVVEIVAGGVGAVAAAVATMAVLLTGLALVDELARGAAAYVLAAIAWNLGLSLTVSIPRGITGRGQLAATLWSLALASLSPTLGWLAVNAIAALLSSGPTSAGPAVQDAITRLGWLEVCSLGFVSLFRFVIWDKMIESLPRDPADGGWGPALLLALAVFLMPIGGLSLLFLFDPLVFALTRRRVDWFLRGKLNLRDEIELPSRLP